MCPKIVYIYIPVKIYFLQEKNRNQEFKQNPVSI